jgi:hypothetical protein
MIRKKNVKHVFFILIIMLILSNLFLISGCYQEVNAQPQITSISTSQKQIVAAAGSIEGGTYVYIKGSGFSA